MPDITEKIEKVVVNIGIGRMSQQPHFGDKILPEIEEDVAKITGQKPLRCAAKKSIAGFKVREGEIVGLKVTLRRGRMRDFITRLVNVVLPRVKDFRGLELKNIDAEGNLNIGLKDHHVFPEVDTATSKVNVGVQVTCVAKDRGRNRMIDFYRGIGVPLKRENEA